MDLPHYDLDSLAYMSTDIVTATMSAGSQQEFTATVADVLYGSLKSGDRLETLSPFLRFFRPMEDGQRVILFLDRRPRQRDFFNPEASRSPFAVVPSGVYLIDAYGHVHQYYQENNPGLYAAEGYRFFPEKSVPTKEQDLRLPTLADVTSRMAESLKSVHRLRPLLDKAATRDDAAALMDLLDARSKGRKECGSDAIIDRLGDQLRSLNDPEISLKAFWLAPDWRSPMAFVDNGNGNKDYPAARVKYLLQTLSDARKNAALRVAAIEILLEVSRFHSGAQAGPSKSLPIDNEWLASSASEIQSLAKAIFDDDQQDGRLRSLCLRFIPLDQPAMAADARRVYARARSEELRFAIEEACLEISDGLYEGLKPPGGPVASVIVVAPERGCIKATGDNIAFLERYHERKDFHESGGTAGYPRFVLANLRTNQRFVPRFSQLSGWSSLRNGEMMFEFSLPLDVPSGDYTVTPEFSRNDEVISTGHKLMVAIRDTPAGRRLAPKNAVHY